MKGKKRRELKRSLDIKNNTDVPKMKEKLKQQIQAKAQRIRSYEKKKQFLLAKQDIQRRCQETIS